MSCNPIGKDADCKCYRAVMRTFDFLSAQEPYNTALEAAQIVYRHHHPEDSKASAHLVVERWVSEDHVH